MTRPAILFVLSAFIAAPDPASSQNGPLFLNATVVRAEPQAHRIVVTRDAGNEIVLPVEGDAVAALAGLQRGDKVILKCRAAGPDSPTSPQAVTGIRPAVAGSEGEPRAPRVPPHDGDGEDGRLQPARVLETDVAGRLVAVADEAGTTHVMSVRGAAVPKLRQLRPGDSVSLRMAPVKEPDGKVATAVVRIDVLAQQRSLPRSEEPLSSGAASVVGVPSNEPPVAGGIPLWLVNNPIPSVPRAEPNVVVVLPPSRAGQSAETAGGVTEEQAVRELDAAATALAVRAGDIDRRWFAFRQLCLRESGPASTRGRDWFRLLDGAIPGQSDDACRASRDELTRIAREFEDQLGIVESAARRAGLPPGPIRETLRRHNIDL